jgi:transposase
MQSGFEIKSKAGIRKTKTDKADSFMIAQYALSNSFSAEIDNKYDENIELLHDLLSARNRLIDDIKKLQVPLDELKNYGGKRNYDILHKAHESAFIGLKETLKNINQSIEDLVKSNSNWQENIDLVCSIKGVGMVVCLWILVYTKNFSVKYNARQFASLAGVAPFVYQSGSSVRKGSHTHHCSHKFLKGILHTAAMSAIRCNQPIKEYFTKKKAEGKKGFLPMNNVKNKLIQVIFAVVRSKKPYDNDYIHPKAA